MDIVLHEENNASQVDHLSFQYQSGIRANFGMDWCDDWGLEFSYLYYSPKQHENFQAENGQLQPTQIVIPSLDFISVAFASYSLNLQQLDCLAMHRSCCNTYSDASYFFGGRALWLKEFLLLQYSNNSQIASVIDAKNRMNGYGVVGGGEYFLKLCYFFHLYIKGTIGVLYASFKDRTNTKELPDFQTEILKNCESSIFSPIEVAVGIAYNGPRIFCIKPSLVLGYELHNWVAFQGFSFPVDAENTKPFHRNNCSFGFDGLFFRVALEF